MIDLGRGESLASFLLIGTLAMIGVYFPRMWGFGLTAGLLLIAFYEAR